jgi:hypothetical protein
VEVSEDGEVCFDVSVREADGYMSAATYQAHRIPLFTAEAYATPLGSAATEELGTVYAIEQTNSFSPTRIFAGKLSASFRDVHRDRNRLVIDGTLLWNGEPRLAGMAYIILRDEAGNDYVYQANSSIHGRFIASIDLKQLPAGRYVIDIAGALIDGNDVQNDKKLKGHFRTEYYVGN